MILTEIAYAKINLALHVRKRRTDGYHDLETVFAFCADGDVLSAELAQSTSLSIDGPFGSDLSATDNLVIKAAQAIGISARLTLTKNLPVASGIGGGSADAAATLRALSLLSPSSRDIPAIATKLGADMLACLLSQTMRGEGVGERLAPEASVAGMPVLLVNPRISLSTASVFKLWDGKDRGALGDWRTGRNDLEAPARSIVPEIGDLLDWLIGRQGVTVSRMSGSGATCFALFANHLDCALASAEVVRAFPGYWTMETVLR